MLGFILSKLNLLILVAAIFSIAAFFLFHLSNVAVGFEAKQLMDQYSRSASIILSSQNSCTSKSYFLSPYIETTASDKMYYVMKISSAPVSSPGGQQNLLIFSIRPKKTPELVLAAESFPLDATPFFCGTSGGSVNCNVSVSEGVTLDPQKAIPINAFYLIKQVSSGQNYLYVVPCNLSSCDGVKAQASQSLVDAGQGGFQC